MLTLGTHPLSAIHTYSNWPKQETHIRKKYLPGLEGELCVARMLVSFTNGSWLNKRHYPHSPYLYKEGKFTCLSKMLMKQTLARYQISDSCSYRAARELSQLLNKLHIGISLKIQCRRAVPPPSLYLNCSLHCFLTDSYMATQCFGFLSQIGD